MPSLPQGEGWGEGIRKATVLIFIIPHPGLIPEGEGVTTFYDILLWEKHFHPLPLLGCCKSPLSLRERVGVRGSAATN
jgi:hypothetical protein